MPESDDEIIAAAWAGATDWREKRVKKVMEEGGFDRKQAEWLVDHDVDEKFRFSPSDTPIRSDS
jgi:hypothetical protein